MSSNLFKKTDFLTATGKDIISVADDLKTKLEAWRNVKEKEDSKRVITGVIMNALPSGDNISAIMTIFYKDEYDGHQDYSHLD